MIQATTTLSRIGLLLTVSLVPSVSHAQWDATGGDHGGSDWVMEDGAVLSGVHTNIGRLVVAEGVTVRVAPLEDGAGGLLELHACELEMRGVINADAAGSAGAIRAPARGGRQGAGPGGGCGGGPGSCVGQGATGGSYGGIGGTAETDQNWARNNQCALCDNPAEGHCFGAAGEVQGTPDGEDIAPGSGGGSGGNSCNCNGAGGLGGAGGGAVKLLIHEEALVEGTITANGATPEVDDSNCGYHPGGGGGSGGGIFLLAEELSGGGTLTAMGGGGGETDGCPAQCGNWAWAGGGGGGGRIKTFSLNDTFDGEIDVTGGEGGAAPGGNYAYAGLAGADGTVNRSDELIVDLIPCAGPPRIRIEHELTFGEAQEFVLVLSARDPDGGEVDYLWDLNDDGEFDDAQGLEVTTEFPDDGDYPIAVQGTDDEGDVAVFEFVVHIVNRPPTIESEPELDALEEDEYVYEIEAVDPAGARDPLEVELIQSPVGMELDGFALRWTPTILQALDGRFGVSIRVSDGDGGSVAQSWQVQVSWLDRDGDGMSDGWELQYGLDPDDASDADEDLDGDGLTNLQEFRQRRDPTRSGTPDVPDPLTPEDGDWVVTSTPDLVIGNAFDPDNDLLTYSFAVSEDQDFRRVHFAEQGVAEGLQGRTTWQVRLPLREGFVYWWRARASDGPFHSEWTVPRSFTVNSFPEPPSLPELQTPRDGGPVGTPSPSLTVGAVFDPDGDPVEIHYEIFSDEAALDLVRSIVTPQAAGDAVVVGIPDPALDEDTDYWWRAEAVDAADLTSGFTEIWSFRVNSDNALPTAPTLLRPSDRAQIDELVVLLALQAGEDPDGDRVVHRIEVDVSPEFDSPAVEVFADLEPAMGDVVTVELTGRTDNTLYYWRARSEDGLDTSEWVGRRFVVSLENEAPGAPTPRSPVDDEAVSADSVTLIVDPAADPDYDRLRYVFQIALDGDFSDMVGESDPIADSADADSVSWEVGGLDDGVTYHWRARATDPLRERGPWSSVATFLVDGSLQGGEDGGDGGEDGAGADDGEGVGGGDGEGAGPGGGGGAEAGGGEIGVGGGGDDGGVLRPLGRSSARGCACEAAGGDVPADVALVALSLAGLALRRR